jgi:hypothetical protein
MALNGNLDYYMGLNYEVKKKKAEDGECFATIEELPGYMATAPIKEQALAEIEEAGLGLAQRCPEKRGRGKGTGGKTGLQRQDPDKNSPPPPSGFSPRGRGGGHKPEPVHKSAAHAEQVHPHLNRGGIPGPRARFGGKFLLLG